MLWRLIGFICLDLQACCPEPRGDGQRAGQEDKCKLLGSQGAGGHHSTPQSQCASQWLSYGTILYIYSLVTLCLCSSCLFCLISSLISCFSQLPKTWGECSLAIIQGLVVIQGCSHSQVTHCICITVLGLSWRLIEWYSAPNDTNYTCA